MATNQFVDLRGLEAIVVHPQDRDRDELVGQLSRIGLNATAVWPYPAGRLPRSEFVLIATDHMIDVRKTLAELLAGPDSVVVAIIANESPTTVEKVVTSGVDAVIVKPLRARGLYSMLVHAAQRKCLELERRSEVAVLKRKVEGARKVEKAKEILMRQLNVTGDEAFAIIRRCAMDERRPIEEIAVRLIDAERVLAKGVSVGAKGAG